MIVLLLRVDHPYNLDRYKKDPHFDGDIRREPAGSHFANEKEQDNCEKNTINHIILPGIPDTADFSDCFPDPVSLLIELLYFFKELSFFFRCIFRSFHTLFKYVFPALSTKMSC